MQPKKFKGGLPTVLYFALVSIFQDVFPDEFPKFTRWSSPRLKGGLTAGRKVLLRKNPRKNFVEQTLKCKIYTNARTVVDLADLRALSLARKQFTCRFTGLPQRLYGSELGSHKYTHKRFPSHEGATDFTDFQKRVDFIHITFQISQRSFTDFSKGFILAPSLFLG